ncbi:MAG: hypothetical protein IJ125_03430 [Atopobiaceae bacterium]|nr:hypothetical protein [Atopobiaceae bacterium]
MRKVNAIVSAALLIVFILHAVSGALLLSGASAQPQVIFSRILTLLLLVHLVIGVVLTVDGFRAIRASGVHYREATTRLLAVRLSGLAIAVFIGAHVASLWMPAGDVQRMSEFGLLQLVMNIAFVVAVAVHILCNIRPLLISLGIPLSSPRVLDIAIALSVVLCAGGIAFIIYFIRWQVM